MSLSSFQRRRRELANNEKLKETKEGVKDDNNPRQSKKRPANKGNK